MSWRRFGGLAGGSGLATPVIRFASSADCIAAGRPRPASAEPIVALFDTDPIA